MRKLRLAIAAALACSVLPALAQAQGRQADGAEPNGPSRYTFNRVDDGFLRLDNLSGQVAFCSPHGVGWACQAVPEDRAALEKEIARLQSEVASLKAEIAALRESPPPPGPPAHSARRRKSGNLPNCARTSRAPAPSSRMPGTGWWRCW